MRKNSPAYEVSHKLPRPDGKPPTILNRLLVTAFHGKGSRQEQIDCSLPLGSALREIRLVPPDECRALRNRHLPLAQLGDASITAYILENNAESAPCGLEDASV